MENAFALIVAGGMGLRMGGNTPKQLIEIEGRPVLAHTMQHFLDFHSSLQVVVTLHPSLMQGWNEFKNQYFPAKDQSRMQGVAGGKERVNSVHNGLRQIAAGLSETDNPLVAIHDGVRPFVTRALLQRAFDLAAQTGNAVVAMPVKSSLRRTEPDGTSVAVDRSLYYHVQTPQIFRLRTILSCLDRRPHDNFTDDASIAEFFGEKIHLSEGSYDNLKITTPEDVLLARMMLQNKA